MCFGGGCAGACGTWLVHLQSLLPKLPQGAGAPESTDSHAKICTGVPGDAWQANYFYGPPC